MAAWASVDAVAPKRGDVVVVSGAAGGVGSIAVQLLRLRGATVIAIASPMQHIRDAAPSGRIDAWVDLFGGGYVEMAIRLGVAAERINTIIDWATAQKHGAKTQGTAEAGGAAELGKLAALVADEKVEVPIAARYPLDQVREAFTELEKRHTHGKIVLVN
jgi:NADPH:quinone reductase-like Zn-dependent oxidoreductase